MRILHDYQGLAIRLTDERLGHILEHPEMDSMESAYLTDKTKQGARLWPSEH